MYLFTKVVGFVALFAMVVTVNAQWQPGKASTSGATEVQKVIQQFIQEDEG